MPTFLTDDDEVFPGVIYEDPFFHPCLCIGVEGGFAWGISLIDGSSPRMTSLDMSGIRLLTPQEAWKWRQDGIDVVRVRFERELGSGPDSD